MKEEEGIDEKKALYKKTCRVLLVSMQCLFFEVIHKQSNYGLPLKLILWFFLNTIVIEGDLELYEYAFDSFSLYISKNKYEHMNMLDLNVGDIERDMVYGLNLLDFRSMKRYYGLSIYGIVIVEGIAIIEGKEALGVEETIAKKLVEY